MSKLDEILGQYAGFASVAWDKDGVFMTEEVEAKTDEAKQALYTDLLKLIGEDKKFNNVYQWQQDEPLNLLRQELRTKLKEYFGVTE